jgi:SNF2 family DNA or RNA helicase
VANQRLTNLVRSVVQRRTHSSRLFECPIITLPEIGEKTVAVKPLAIEKALYDMTKDFYIDGINCIASSNNQEAQNRCFLTMILKLRMLNSHPLCVQDILKKLLAVDANLAKLKSLLVEHTDDETDCSGQIFSLIQKLVLAAKQAKKPLQQTDTASLTTQLLERIHEWMNNDNQEECQARMKCARCDAVATQTRVTACLHLICEDCLQILKESGSSEDSKVVCPACTDRVAVDTEDFDMDPNILSLRLGYMGVKKREKGNNKKSKKKNASSTDSLFMSVFEQNADDCGRLTDIDWVNAEGEGMPSSKIIQIRELIHKWIAEDKEAKIVIFTQFRTMAAILAAMCMREEWAHVMVCYINIYIDTSFLRVEKELSLTNPTVNRRHVFRQPTAKHR